MIQILLVDDHHLFRAGLREIISQSPDMQVIGEAANADEACELLKNQPIDVVLLDVMMPGMKIEDFLGVLRGNYPDLRCIVLTTVEDDFVGSTLLNQGALSYLTKTCSNTTLLEAIQKAYRNERFISPDVSQRLAYRLLKQKKPSNNGLPFNKLSSREVECLSLMAQGKNTKEISRALNIHEKTINTYRHRIYQKFEVNNEVDLIRQAIRYNLIESGSIVS